MSSAPVPPPSASGSGPVAGLGATAAPQRVVKIRRDYNDWVASETMEDYALRYTPRSARRWGAGRVANMAFGASSFLVLEAVGATLLVRYGFSNAALAILVTGLAIFLAGLPISVYAARHGVDMDLLTRGAGFGYLGSTVTSLIYASFTFIFFALEAAVMAYAVELAFDIPPAWGYLLCAGVVLPLVAHGVTTISRLQFITQPLWLLMLVAPYVVVLQQRPELLPGLMSFGGAGSSSGAALLALVGWEGTAGAAGTAAMSGAGTASGLAGLAGLAPFDLTGFCAALTVGLALLTQMGEQADYLRFMPPPAPGRSGRLRWWGAVLIGGPGWVIPGVAKMLGGMALAWLALTLSVPLERAVDPNQMYLAAWEHVFPHYGWAVAATAVFVVISQLKINVTNAYAGSLAWSNFFSRVTHSHPGRVVWMVFNTAIALLLMEMDVFQALGGVLGLYANIAISWLMAVVADLVINKPLGLSPPGIEFRRAHLHDINPVGVGAMAIASLLSVAAHLGAFGPLAQAGSALIAGLTAVVVAPLIAWATRGRYYLARQPEAGTAPLGGRAGSLAPAGGGAGCQTPGGACHGCAPASAPPREVTADIDPPRLQRCTVCERNYESEDMAACPAYGGAICSLCCTLDARCNDLCKPAEARLAVQWQGLLGRLLPRVWLPALERGLGHYLLLMLLITPLLAGIFTLLYHQELTQLGARLALNSAPEEVNRVVEQFTPLLRAGFLKAAVALWLVAAVGAWWLVLAHQSRRVAQAESNRQTEALHAQTEALQAEIASHRRTDAQLQQAKAAADAANQAKSRYITTVSHELRTPLNAILGYAQLLEADPALPAHRRQAVQVIRRGGDHLLSLIEGTLDIARIESGRLSLDVKPCPLREVLDELASLIEVQATEKGLRFSHELQGVPAWVRADEKRLRQILINLLGNAVKYTATGQVTLRCSHAFEMARFEIEDSGPGMSAAELDKVFEPFARGSSAASGAAAAAGSSGLGLTITRMLTQLMGGELAVRSQPGQGTVFSLKLFLPEVVPPGGAARRGSAPRVTDAPGSWALESPAAPDPDPSLTGPTQLPAPISTAPAHRGTVLCVDNEATDRQFLRDLLAPRGWTVLQAESGEAALALLAEAQAGTGTGADGAAPAPDAILLDLAMPGMDGWTTLAALRDRGLSSAPVAIVSANAFDKLLLGETATAHVAPGGGEIGPGDFFVKPVRVSELLAWLDRHVPEARRVPAAAAPPAAPGAAASGADLADLADLAGLRRALALGHLRGVLAGLDRLDRLDCLDPPGDAAVPPDWTEEARRLARAFQFEAVARLVDSRVGAPASALSGQDDEAARPAGPQDLV